METVDRKLGSSIYCTFHKYANSEVQKPTDDWIAFFTAVNHLRVARLDFFGLIPPNFEH